MTLIRQLEARRARIGIIGLGYVGLPLVLSYSDAGYSVLGFDIDPHKVEQLNAGQSYLEHFPSERVQAARAAGFEATAEFARAREADALLICVPTPLTRHREPDLSYVLKTLESILPGLRGQQIVSLESTTYPGTTDEELRPRIEAAGFTVGEDIFLVHSPEREDPGNQRYTTRTIPKVIGGSTPACLAAGMALYQGVVEQLVPVSSARAAEMTKLLENIHRAVNIGLVNELKIVADRMGIDIHEVIDAAATKPFGFVAYRPGPGLGGHCIPIDPFYLTWKARAYGVNTRFIELAGEVNSAMPQWVVDKTIGGLNGHRKAVNGSRILMLGVSYKRDIGDMRESPAAEIMHRLRALGAELSYCDPHVPEIPPMRRYPSFALRHQPLTQRLLEAHDCAIVATDHSAFDYAFIAAHAPLVVDTRGVYRQARPNVVKA